MLGSWTEFRWDKNGDGDFDDATETDVRSHNGANEITGRTLENPSPAAGTSVPVTYDHAGNVRLRYETATTRLELTHDAWNRLVRVRRITGNIEDPPMDVARHEYNGLHWRVLSVEDTDTPRDGTLNQRRAYFYSANWQVLEEWVEAEHDPDPYEEGLICDYRMQQFWGVRHIDDAVMLRRQEEVGEDAGDFTRVSFQLTDRQFSVVAVVDESGLLMERVTYDPYGRGQHRWPGDFNGDGYADSGDTGSMTLFTPIDDPAYKADEDLDRNGVIDIDDLVIAASVWWGRGPLGSGQVSDPDGPGNRVGYAGYRFEPSSALYHVRFRWYETGLGRWAQRDPAGYVDGMSRYQYARSRTTSMIDALGLSGQESCANLASLQTKITNIEKSYNDSLKCPGITGRAMISGASSVDPLHAAQIAYGIANTGAAGAAALAENAYHLVLSNAGTEAVETGTRQAFQSAGGAAAAGIKRAAERAGTVASVAFFSYEYANANSEWEKAGAGANAIYGVVSTVLAQTATKALVGSAWGGPAVAAGVVGVTVGAAIASHEVNDYFVNQPLHEHSGKSKAEVLMRCKNLEIARSRFIKELQTGGGNCCNE